MRQVQLALVVERKVIQEQLDLLVQQGLLAQPEPLVPGPLAQQVVLVQLAPQEPQAQLERPARLEQRVLRVQQDRQGRQEVLAQPVPLVRQGLLELPERQEVLVLPAQLERLVQPERRVDFLP